MNHTQKKLNNCLLATVVTTCLLILLTGCGGSNNKVQDQVEDQNPQPPKKQFTLIQGSDKNTGNHPLLSKNPGGPGASSNQSLRAGDVLLGSAADNIMIGGLGVDVFVGQEGDDIIIGGTEDFNSNVDGDAKGADNRDRAFGEKGNDTFIWAPGDGSDFFDGGEGTDVLIFGVLGESKDAAGNTNGAPFFVVSPPNKPGSQDFDGIALDANNQPTVSVSGSPGFCSFVDAVANKNEFAQLNIDHIVRFSLRGIANAFDAGERDDDDGLRVAVTLKNTEFVVCTTRVIDENNSENNIEVFDVRNATATPAQISDLPAYVQALIK